MPKLSLRFSYIITIAVLAVGPAWVLSTFLIDRFEVIFTTNLEEKLSEHARNIGNQLSLELDLLEIELKQASTDLDLALTVHTGAYGHQAGHGKLSVILQNHSMLSSLLLIDKNHEIIEAVPDTALLLELNSTRHWLSKVKKTNNKIANVTIIESPKLIAQLAHYGTQTARTKWNKIKKETINSNKIILIYVPLYLGRSNSNHVQPSVGGILAMLPMQYMIDQLKFSALPTILLSAKYQGKELYKNTKVAQNELLRTAHSISIPGLESEIKLQFSEEKSSLDIALKPLTDDFANVTLISLAIIMMSALVITRLLLTPFNVLARIATIYAKGNYRPITTMTKFRELHNIINVLAQMASRIQFNQRELELRVEERTAELLKTNLELNDAMEKLKTMQGQIVEAEKMAQLGNLVAGVAHEINTPVGVALTAATMESTNFETLKEKLDNNQIKKSDLELHLSSGSEASQMVIRNLKRAAELIRNFKEVAVDQSSEQRRRFNFAAYLNEIISNLRPELRKFDIKMNIVGDNDVELENYPGAFAQIISNFIMNSLNHGFDVGNSYNIDITFVQRAENIILIYKDTGKGVDEATLDKLFIPFFTTARNKGGTGLGLHIVYNLVHQRLGGTIKVESTLDKGICFELTFPKNAPQE